MRTRRLKLLIVVTALALAAAACAEGDDETAASDGEAGQVETGSETLDEVQRRDELQCGVNEGVPGFGVVDDQGNFSGFDIDFCRVIAAAVLGDADKVDYTPLTAETRFTALQGGEIDVLVRNTTWTATRDGAEGAAFATTTFYDGQGMMVRAEDGFDAIEDLDGASICVLGGTTTELNLASRFNAAGLGFEPATFDDVETLREAFIARQCDAWTSDKSQLAGQRSAFPEAEGGPEALEILEETFSKEPLGPAVRDGDSQWFDVVNWAVIATIQAEEFGITSENVQEQLESDNPDILRFLGQAPGEDEGVLDPRLGLREDFAVAIIEQVGNYGEIYDRNVGANSNLGLERIENALWTDGGLLYAPPYR